jgi:hypothetical protein
MKTLSETLAFKAPEIVLKFQVSSGLSIEDSEIVFNETKKWLWACAKRTQDFEKGLNVPGPLLITPEIRTIDEMWHCFLLFTKDYLNFCEIYLGRFIHHEPLTQNQIRDFQNLRDIDPEEALRNRQTQLKPQLEFLYDLFGPETVKLWYRELPRLPQ